MSNQDGGFITPMGEGTSSTHELYLSYVEAGFTQDQAMQIILVITAEGVRAHEQRKNR